jgi:hypothetical protein
MFMFFGSGRANSKPATGTNRNQQDPFYTRPEIAQSCFNFLSDRIPLDKFKHIVEPSAGSGSFSLLFEGDRRLIALDIKPKLLSASSSKRHQNLRM